MIKIVAANISTRFQMGYCRNEDGCFPRFHDVVYVEAIDGRSFYLSNTSVQAREDENGCDDGFEFTQDRYEAEKMLTKVAKRGYIDEALWIEVEEHTTEERAYDSYLAEQEDRRQHGVSYF